MSIQSLPFRANWFTKRFKKNQRNWESQIKLLKDKKVYERLHNGRKCKKSAKIHTQVIAGVLHYSCGYCKITKVREFTRDEIVVMDLINHKLECSRHLPPKYGVTPSTGRACFECRNCNSKATVDPTNELILREDQMSTE